MSRESAFTALFTKLQGVAGVVTVSRKLDLLENVPPPNMPALYVTLGNQTVVTKVGFPPKRTLRANVFLYVAAADASVASGALLNPLLDAIEAALAPAAPQVQQTLGGAVAHAWIEGTIDVYEAVKTQRAAALIPITMLIP